MKLQSVILSGGSGTRLWPLSREKYPKQLLALFNDNSMLQETALRMKKFAAEGVDVAPVPIVVSNQEYRFIIAEQLKQIGMPAQILLEPCGRNTAPALTVTALQVAHQDGDAIMLVMPADHLIGNVDEFYRAVDEGLPKALSGGIVCFGIQPTRPDVGYGYIKTLPLDGGALSRLDTFVEKPNAELAQQYLDSGEYYWNSGIFMLKASVWLSVIGQLNKEIYESCVEAVGTAQTDTDFVWLNQKAFSASPDDSIDYAVMEHVGADNSLGIESFVVAMDAGWSDVGAWDAVWDASVKDENGNVGRGKGHTVFHHSKNSMAHAANKRLVSILGLEDVVVIDTQDAVLVAHKNALPEIKQVINKVKEQHIHLTQHWREVFRPWGSYDSIDHGSNFQVKRIVVNPGHVLSLQMHHHRAEHWIVVKGTGKITRGDEVFILSENQSTYIPLGVVHRLENPGKFPLELIEVQSGSYLGEDDIVRLEDVYGRVANAEEQAGKS